MVAVSQLPELQMRESLLTACQKFKHLIAVAKACCHTYSDHLVSMLENAKDIRYTHHLMNSIEQCQFIAYMTVITWPRSKPES